MKRASLVRVVLLTALMGVALIGCERQVTGETYEGQIHGGRSLQVSRESPPHSATGTGAPAEKPASTRSWTVRESDPAIRGLLAASGARIVLRDPPRPRPIAPPPAPVQAVPPTVVPPTAVPPTAVAPAAAPAAVAPAVAMPIARPIRAVAPRPAVPAAAPAPAAPAPAAPAPAAPAPAAPAPAPPAQP